MPDDETFLDKMIYTEFTEPPIKPEKPVEVDGWANRATGEISEEHRCREAHARLALSKAAKAVERWYQEAVDGRGIRHRDETNQRKRQAEKEISEVKKRRQSDLAKLDNQYQQDRDDLRREKKSRLQPIEAEYNESLAGATAWADSANREVEEKRQELLSELRVDEFDSARGKNDRREHSQKSKSKAQ